MRRVQLVGAALAVLACTALARAESRPRYGGAVEGSLLGAPVVVDPPLAQGHAELTSVGLVFDTLYQVGADGVAHPHLAAALPVVEPGRARITIRRGVRFHDGSELTAVDVAASLDRVRTTSSRWILSAIKAIRYEGDTIELALNVPVDDLAARLALPQTAIAKAGKPGADGPLGTGPFAVQAIDRRNHRLVLHAFDDHFAGRPYLDRLVLRWYEVPDGEARAFERGLTQLSARGAAAFIGAQPKYRAGDVEGPAAVLVYVGFGRAHMDLTSDRAFRRALDLALARGALASVGSGERVVPSRLPLPVEAGAPPLRAAERGDDLAGARLALADAARRVKALERARLRQLQLEILVEVTRPDDREVAERVAHALRKLGIGSVITAVSAPTLRDRVRRGATDLYIGHLAAPVTTAWAWWGSAFAAGGDPWAQQQLAVGALTQDAATKVFRERLPIVPLLFRAVRIWHRSDVRGLGFDASGRPLYAELFLFGEPVRAKARP